MGHLSFANLFLDFWAMHFDHSRRELCFAPSPDSWINENKISVYYFTRPHGCYFFPMYFMGIEDIPNYVEWFWFIGVLFGWNSLKFICSIFFRYHQDETIQLHPTIQKMVGSNTSPTTFHHLVLHQGLIGLMRCRLPWTGWWQRVCHGSECSLEWFVVLGSTGVDGTQLAFVGTTYEDISTGQGVVGGGRLSLGGWQVPNILFGKGYVLRILPYLPL